MFLFLILFFIVFIFSVVLLIYKIKLLEDELDDLYDTCYTYIYDSFGIEDGDF
ncbi:MAG: hypothetical protein ACI4VQ_07095 [Clostridia bacterium]